MTSVEAQYLARNRALRGAFRRGIDDALAGALEADCPYKDRRTLSGRTSWSRAFQTAWRDGWKYATNDREQALITVAYWPKRVRNPL